VQCGGLAAVGEACKCCSAVAAVVCSRTRATDSRKRRTKGSKSTMSREIDEKLKDAAAGGDVGEMERLIAAGADPNAFEGTDDWTPLQWAARNGHVAAIAALLKAGAHVDGPNSGGYTPLMLAAGNGHTAAIDALIAAGADVHHANGGGETALHRASQFGHLDAARVLLEAGAKAEVHNKLDKRPTDVVRDHRDRDRSCDVVCEYRRSRHVVRCRRVVRRFAPDLAWTRPTKPPSARC